MRAVGDGEDGERVAEAVAELAGVFGCAGLAVLARFEGFEPAGIAAVHGGAGEGDSRVVEVVDAVMNDGGQVLIAYQTPRHEGPSAVYTRLDPDGLGPRPFGPAVLVTVDNVGVPGTIDPVNNAVCTP